MTKRTSSSSKNHSDDDDDDFSDSEEEEEVYFRKRDLVRSVKATGIAPSLVPAARRDLLLFLLDEITLLKKKRQLSSSVAEAPGGGGSSSNRNRRSGRGSRFENRSNSTMPVVVTTTRERLLSTTLYWEPTLPQFIASLHPQSPFVTYLLHRLKVALSSPDDLDDLMTSFSELLGDPRIRKARRGGEGEESDGSDQSDPSALSDEDDSAEARIPETVPGGMPRYIEKKSVLGLFLRRVTLESSRMLFDGLSALYDQMTEYTHGSDEILNHLLKPTAYGTRSTPQKKKKIVASVRGVGITSSSGGGGGGSSSSSSSSSSVSSILSGSVRGDPGRVSQHAERGSRERDSTVPPGWTNSLSARQKELHVGRDVWQMHLVRQSVGSSLPLNPIATYEQNERDIATLSALSTGSAVEGPTDTTMLKCLYLKHLNALEHRE